MSTKALDIISYSDQTSSSRSFFFWPIHGLHMDKEVLSKPCALPYIFLPDNLIIWCADKGQTCMEANPPNPCCTLPLVHHFLYQTFFINVCLLVHLHLFRSFIHTDDKQTALVQQWHLLKCPKSFQDASTKEQNCCRLKVVSVVWLNLATERTCAVAPCKGK